MSGHNFQFDLIEKAASKESAGVSLAEPESPLEIDLPEHKLFFEVESLKQGLKETQDTHALRLGYAEKIFRLVAAWLLVVVIAVFFAGFSLLGFNLSDKVMIAFITSTNVTVVGLFVVVAKWMFPGSGGKK